MQDQASCSDVTRQEANLECVAFINATVAWHKRSHACACFGNNRQRDGCYMLIARQQIPRESAVGLAINDDKRMFGDGSCWRP